MSGFCVQHGLVDVGGRAEDRLVDGLEGLHHLPSDVLGDVRLALEPSGRLVPGDDDHELVPEALRPPARK